MMDLLTVQAPTSRRALSVRPFLRHTLGHFPGDGTGADGLNGRLGDDYVTCYPMKKSRSHTSMVQTTESGLEADDCGYVVTSAPDNAFCLIDTDGDGDDDVGSACCEKDASVETSCCCTHNHTEAQLQLGHSASGSTALSSVPSGFSSLCPPVLLASGLLSSCGDAAHAGAPCPVQVAAPEVLAEARQQQKPQPNGQQVPIAPAAAVQAGAGPAAAVAAADAAEAVCGGDGAGGNIGGSDLMGVFSAATTEQWAAFQVAVVGCSPAPPLPLAAATGRPGAHVADAAAPPQPEKQPQQHRQRYQDRSSVATIDWFDVAAPALSAAPPGAPSAPATATAVSGTFTFAELRSVPSGGCTGGGSGGCSDGSATSIASLWAAVNSVASAAVYDSTDDNAQAGQFLGRFRGWSNTSAAAAAAAAAPPPVVAPSGGSFTAGHRQHPPPRPQAPGPTSHVSTQEQHQLQQLYDQRAYGNQPRSNNHYDNHHHQQHHLEMFLAAHHSHHAGVTVKLPALMVQQQQQPDDGPGALSLPGSPAARTAVSCAAGSGGANNVFAATREMLLRECCGPDPEQRQQQQPYGYVAGNGDSATADGTYSHGDGSGHGGGAYNRAAEQTRSNAHSRYSVDLSHYSPRQPYASQQVQHQIQHRAAAAAAAVQSTNPGSPSRRRAGGALPPQPTSYTTYGYRRARSSLAALEQSAAGGGAAAVDGDAGSSSSSEDDTEEATRRITAAFRTHTGMVRSSGWGLLGADSAPTTPGAEAARRDHWAVAAAANGGGGHGHSPGGGSRLQQLGGGGGGSGPGVRGGSGECGSEAAGGDRKDCGVGGGDCSTEEDGEGGALTRKRSSYHLTTSHAAVELFLRLNHARQTMDFVKRQTQLFAGLDKAHMSVWEALQTLNELREYEAVLMAEAGEAQEIADLALLDHAFQTAELCRLHHPDLDWLHLVGLMHGLGKLLAHRRFGSQPQWAICGETYPLGCRFSPHILGSQYFTANPDRRRRLYNTPTGLYDPGCGLLNVVMSWSAPEYLYLVLSLNSAQLPQDALWVLRHSKFLTLSRPHSCYLPLCSAEDLRRLPLLRSFQSLAAYRRVELPEGFALRGEERAAYYSALIAKYIGAGKLHW